MPRKAPKLRRLRLVTYVMPPVMVRCRAEADRIGLTLSEYVAAILTGGEFWSKRGPPE